MELNHLKWLMVKVRENLMLVKIKELQRRRLLMMYKVKSMKDKVLDHQRRRDKVNVMNKKRRMNKDKGMIVERKIINKTNQENKMLMIVFEKIDMIKFE